MCLEYVKKVIANNGENHDRQERRYYSVFPVEVAKRTEAFDNSAWPINIVGEYRIAQEISENLDNCTNDNQRERYIIEIISIFEEWSEIFTPVARLMALQKMQENDSSINTEQEIEQEIERASNLHDAYLDILRNAKNGTIDYYLNHWHRAYYKFGRMLAAVCAEHNINLLEIQAKRGIWIIEKLNVLEIQSYFGYNMDFTYANNLLKSLPRTDVTEALILTEKDGTINSESAWNNSTIDAPQEANAKIKRRGRKVGNFRDNLMVDEKEKDIVIEKLRLLIAGRKGKDVALMIYSCIKLGWLIKPSFSQVENTFGGIGNKSGYNNYVNNPNKFTEHEISGMIERLKAL